MRYLPTQCAGFYTAGTALKMHHVRFKPNDAVFILPRYANLYPGHSAIVTGATADPFRTMFNEYTVEFVDRSSANLFEFQIIEDVLNYTTFIASLVFDS